MPKEMKTPTTPKSIIAMKLRKKLLLLHLKPSIENDRREKIDKEELLIELQNVRISTLAYQQHNYSTTKPKQ